MSGDVVVWLLIGELLIWGLALGAFAWQAHGSTAGRILRRGVVGWAIMALALSIFSWRYFASTDPAVRFLFLERAGSVGMVALGVALSAMVGTAYLGGSLPVAFAVLLLIRGRERAEAFVEGRYRKLAERPRLRMAAMLATMLTFFSLPVFMWTCDPAGGHGAAMTPDALMLHVAVEGRRVDILASLLEHGVDPNLPLLEQKGGTGLHMAARSGDVDSARLLLDYDADVNAADNRGKTPLDYAIEMGHDEVAELLRQHRARE